MTDIVLTPTPDLCDQHADKVRVADPIFKNFGGKNSPVAFSLFMKCCVQAVNILAEKYFGGKTFGRGIF